jgi:uncharacterized protein YndB with AHSA1/START domain
MPEPSIIHNTFAINRIYPKAPEVVFAAFADPEKKKRWYGESPSHKIEEFVMDFRAGGSERFRYRFNEGSPLAGKILSNEGKYEEIVMNRSIVISSSMSVEGKRVSVSLVTIELLPAAGGTELICTHQGAFFEGSGGPEMREMGWRTLFDRLATEVAG